MNAREVLGVEVGGLRQVGSMKEVECYWTLERQYRSRHIRSKKEQSMSKDRRAGKNGVRM